MNVIPPGVPNAPNDPALGALDAPYKVVALALTTAVIGNPQGGKYFFTGSAIDAVTLAAPTAGLPSAGGNDGQSITFTDTVGYAHTITCGAGIIAPSHHLATFNGTVGSFAKFESYNGVYYVSGTGVTFS